VLALFAIAAAASAAAVTVARPLTAEFGFHPETGISFWRARDPEFADSAQCGQCHTIEHARLVSASHAGIGCQSCHGPLAEHADRAGLNADNGFSAAPPASDVCVKCHTAVLGRPASFRTIVPADHYTSTCLACHDPHTGIANRPPVVSHTLDQLPPCLTCHGPAGFKARNVRHPLAASSDKACLECHAAGRGPDADRTPPPTEAP
jgi:hypothetical protein